jgi:phosphoglycolate phosphatase-like HAD superfamily hydrolase
LKKLVVFDLDGTLAESKSTLDAEMASLLNSLLEIVKASVNSLRQATGSPDLKPEQTWGDTIEDRGSQITFSGLGQTAVKFDVHGPLLEVLGDRAYMGEELRARPGA